MGMFSSKEPKNKDKKPVHPPPSPQPNRKEANGTSDTNQELEKLKKLFASKYQVIEKLKIPSGQSDCYKIEENSSKNFFFLKIFKKKTPEGNRISDFFYFKTEVTAYLKLETEFPNESFFPRMKAYGKIENDKVYFFKENSILNDNEDASFFIILPFFQDSLRSKISAWKRGANYSWEQRKEECLRIFDNLSKSVNTYYKLSWIHGDLKPDNICFNGNDIIIIDWATAYQWDKQQNRAFTLDGTSSNLPIGICSPPYVLATQERHLDKDFYSLKIILWEMFELPHFSKTQNLAKKNQSPCFSEKTLESILNDISNRLEKTINKQELLEIQEKIKNINVEEEQVQSKRAGIASTVKLESIPAEAYEKLANKPVELKQTPTIYAVKSGGSIPTSWSQELWKSCWNEEFVDFTEDDWCTLSLQEQRKLAGEYQKWYGEKYNKGQYEKTYSIKRGTASTKIEMLLIPPGKYWQGSPETESERLSNENRRKVWISKAFWCGKYPVTQKQWKGVMTTEPSYFKGENLPVEQVSWEECKEFCEKTKFEMLTEAQWEYACRGGTTSAYNYGESFERGYCNSASYWAEQDLLNHEAWQKFGFLEKWRGLKAQTSEVGFFGEKGKNGWGLSDMHGNVWEWCKDYYKSSYGGEEAKDPVQDKEDPLTKDFSSNRVYRGGGWFYSADGCRSADRHGNDPSYRLLALGFRVSGSL